VPQSYAASRCYSVLNHSMKRTLKERRTTEAPHDNEMKRAKPAIA